MLKATFDVLFTAEAEKHYNALDTNMKRRVNRAIALLVQNPLFAPNIVKLKASMVDNTDTASEVIGLSTV